MSDSKVFMFPENGYNNNGGLFGGNGWGGGILGFIEGGEITITLPKGMKVTEARPVNLRGERAGEPIAVKDGKFSFMLGAWAPKSFVLVD